MNNETAAAKYKRARELLSKAREYLLAKRYEVVNHNLLQAATDVQRSLEGINSWGHRKVTPKNIDRIRSLFSTLEERSTVLEKTLHHALEER